MQIEKIEPSTPSIPTKQTTMLQKIQYGLQKILGNSKTPQEIYNFLTHLSVVTRNEFMINEELYKEQENSILFVNNIQTKILEKLKENKYFYNGNKIEKIIGNDGRFSMAGWVNGIPPNAIQTIKADWLHPINSEKFYSVNNMSAILQLPGYDVKRLLHAMKPIDMNITTHHCCTEYDEQFKYFSLGDIVIKIRPSSFMKENEIHFDIITLIKETSFPDETTFDGGHFRKLVGIAKPYEAINTPQLIGGGQQVLDQ